MSGDAPMDGERARHLMMAALDGEISDRERDELDRLLESDPALRSEWDRMRRVKEATRMVRLQRPPEEVWDTYWASVYNRAERGLGWILASIGAILILSYAAWLAVERLILDPGVPILIKAGLIALSLGAVILVVSVAREKLSMRSKDPYREVDR